MSLRVTLMGTGTSTGVPRIACDCAVCTSDDPRNTRLRAGVLLRWDTSGGEEATAVVDTSPDFRRHALTHDVRQLHAVLFTHAHADHIYGLDDVRIFNFLMRRDMPCYGSPHTLAAIRRHFSYVFEATQEGGGKPHLRLLPVEGPFEVRGLRITPVPVLHGSLPVNGYRSGDFALVTDVNVIPEASYDLLSGVEVLVLGALRHRPHPTHFNFTEAFAAAQRVGARRTILTHLCHEVDATAPTLELPPGVEIGYDGLELEVER